MTDFASCLSPTSIKEGKVNCHVCGSIKSVPNLYATLLKSGIPVLSLGFSGEEEKENLDISKIVTGEHDTKLGVGVVSNVNVEDEKIIIR